ncbi:MAG TPA: ATP-binding protein [Terriglobales bacterium]|nr:ATP-binding protein [Terriglobales bacterium]
MSLPRINWRLKAILPVVGVLCAGLLGFVWATVSVQGPERATVRLVATFGAFVICAVILVVLAVLVEHPLVELQEKIARLRRGDMSVQVGFAGRNDEIGDLGRNFNEMVRQLRESREEIQRLYRTQMSRAEHFATLGELAAGLAHEIRNPLAGIAGVMNIVARDLPASSAARDVVGDVQQEIQHINRIVSDLLSLARPKPPELRPADLNATAEHAFTLARQQASAREIDFDLVRAEGLPLVEHDVGQIQQVVLNLLLNAIQAIEREGKVGLRLGQQNGHATITVSDTGRGIPAEHLPNIFRPFYTTKRQGTGLGLSLARRIVEEHGGRVEVESAPGQGARFILRLPLRRPQARSNGTSVVE